MLSLITGCAPALMSSPRSFNFPAITSLRAISLHTHHGLFLCFGFDFTGHCERFPAVRKVLCRNVIVMTRCVRILPPVTRARKMKERFAVPGRNRLRGGLLDG